MNNLTKQRVGLVKNETVFDGRLVQYVNSQLFERMTVFVTKNCAN